MDAGSVIAGFVAGLLVLFDLDNIFYIPAQAARKVGYYFWWWIFVLANAGLGGFFYWQFKGWGNIDGVPVVLRALLLGAAYLTLVRSNLSTVTINGTNFPLGFTVLYDGAKQFVYKRLNNIAIEARRDETTKKANSQTLDALIHEARMRIAHDVLLTPELREQDEAWIDQVRDDPKATDEDKRTFIADYILTGEKSP